MHAYMISLVFDFCLVKLKIYWEKLQVGRIQVIAFQSSDGKQNHISKPIALLPVNKSTVIDLESSLSSSESLSARSGNVLAENPEQDTGDSKIVAGSWKVHIVTLKFVICFMLDTTSRALKTFILSEK